MKNKRRMLMARMGQTLVLILAMTVALLPGAPASFAAKGDFSLDFVAAAPTTYDHSTGGGAYDDRTINDDVVESLEGGDFKCGDIVSFFVAITVDDTTQAETDAPQTIELTLKFAKDTTGQPGVGFVDVIDAVINYGVVSGGDGPTGTDSGIIDDGDSTATLSRADTADDLVAVIEVNDLERAEQVILRVDVQLGCDPGSSPTGNVQSRLSEQRLILIQGDVSVDENIPGGEQTISLKHAEYIAGIDLWCTKTVDDDEAVPGQPVMFTITVTNDGPFDSTGVQLEDFNMSNLTYVSDDGGGAYNSGTGIWTVGDLASGASATLHIVATVDAEGGFENDAEIYAADQDDVDSTPNNRDPNEDDICVAIGNAYPTAVTLSSFAAKSSAGGLPSLVWLGLAGVTVLAAGTLFWAKRRSG